MKIICSTCQATAESEPLKNTPELPELPAGWKRHNGAAMCESCWHAGWCTGAMKIRIAEPLGIEWKELDALLAKAQASSTPLANALMHQCLRIDATPIGEAGKVGKCPKLSAELYATAKRIAPELADGSAATMGCIARYVESKYRQSRFKLMRGEVSLPRYDYPAPYPIRASTWHIEKQNDAFIVTATLMGTRFRFRLAGGRDYARYRSRLDALASGAGIRGEMQFCRTAIDGRKAVAVTLVGHWPKAERRASGATVVFRTVPGSLYVGTVAGSRSIQFWGHHDELRRLYQFIEKQKARYGTSLQRLGDDTKVERRFNRHGASDLERRRAMVVGRHKDRIRTATRQIVAAMVGFAVRNGAKTVVLDDTDHSYLPKFNYFTLAAALATSLKERDIDFFTAAEWRQKREADKASALAAQELVELRDALDLLLKGPNNGDGNSGTPGENTPDGGSPGVHPGGNGKAGEADKRQTSATPGVGSPSDGGPVHRDGGNGSPARRTRRRPERAARSAHQPAPQDRVGPA